ncbi:YhbY family RNA-binding protein [Spirochaetota bacterium]
MDRITESLIKSVDEALESRELIKIKFIEFKKEKKELSAQIAENTEAEIIGSIGNIFILYRKKKDSEK